ncbi:MAG: chemotaxis protein CheW [Pseudomonadota bacterium]
MRCWKPSTGVQPDMNDFLEQMWPAFEAEVGEQLDALEQLLVHETATDVDAVFRQFHTIKSSSAMMDFRGMEALAHAAEDLLDLLRRGRRTFDAACRQALLQSVDVLRRQLAEALATRQPPAAEPALVATLRALAGENSSGTPVPDARTGHDAAGQVSAALDAYLAGSRLLLPDLAVACVTGGDLPAGTAALMRHAEAAGLSAPARLLERLVAAMPDQRTALLVDLLNRQRLVEKLGNHDAGTAAAGSRLREQQSDLLHVPLAAADALARGPLADGNDAARWLEAARRLQTTTALLGLAASERLLRLAVQTLRELERGTRNITPALDECLRLAMTLAADLDPVLGEDPPYVGLAEQLLERLQSVLAGHHAEAAPPDLPGLDAQALAGLSASARATLHTALQQGHTLADIDADLEATADNGAAFIEWLSSSGNLLGSHTVFAGSGTEETTRLRFLATLPLTPADIRHALAALDPDGTVFHLRVLNAPDDGGTAAQTPGKTATQAPATTTGNTLRVESRTLDTFVNRLGELVMLRNMMAHTLVDGEAGQGLRRLRDVIAGSHGVDAREREQLLELIARLGTQHERLLQADSRLQGTLGQLQEDVLSLRVVPVGSVFNRMTRVVRQVADSLHKQVRLEISGDDVRIDKGMVDLLVEPLTHLVRNAVDHGLEIAAERSAAGKDPAGTLWLSARQQGNAIVVTVRDDGRGLDLPRILAKARQLGLAGDGEHSARDYSERDIAAFIFAPGFSTAGQVTEVSGRGVGMDVVKTRITQIGGQVDVQTRTGHGTTFELRLPLSVAIQNVVLVEAGGRRHALPERHVNEVLQVCAADVQAVQNQAACLLRGVVLPLYRLDGLLGKKTVQPQGDSDLIVLVLSDGAHRIGLVVDGIVGRQEVFVRDIHPELMRLPGVGGAAILGDGQVVVIADSDNLMALARRNAQSLDGLLRAS